MNKRSDLQFPAWAVSLPDPPRMTSEQYDRFLLETLAAQRKTSGLQYEPVPAEFMLVKEAACNEGQTDER